MRAGAVGRGWFACGVAGPVLIVAGFFAIDAGGTTPVDGARVLLVGDLRMDPARRVLGSAVGMFGALLLVPFAGALRLRLGQPPLDVAVVVFAAVAVAGALVHGAFRLSVAAVVDDPVAAQEVARVVAVLEPVGLIVMTWALAAFAASLAVGGVRSRLLHPWMAAAGLLLVLAALAFSGSDRGGLSVILLVWVAGAAALCFAASGDAATRRAAADR